MDKLADLYADSEAEDLDLMMEEAQDGGINTPSGDEVQTQALISSVHLLTALHHDLQDIASELRVFNINFQSTLC